MMKTNRADELIEYIEIKASDNYYPIEDDEDYKLICSMVEDAGYNGDEFINKKEFLEAFHNLRDKINNW